MPVLRIMSIYRQRRKESAPDLAQARADMEQFKGSLVARFGEQTADAVRQRLQWTEDMVFGRVEVLPLPQEAEDAVKIMRTLSRKVKTVLKEIRTPDCWFREDPTPISVLETVGLSWRAVEERCSADGRLPVESVLWLLGVLGTTEQIMPSKEQVSEWAACGCTPCHLPVEWRQLLKRRGLRLVRLLSKAAELEEEIEYAGG